jgi:hypothetical protein
MDDESFMWIDGVGSEIWKNKKGERHRLGGPAYISKDGREDWYKDGKWHRLDGPAVIIQSRNKRYWYIGGKQFYTKEDYFDALPDEAKTKCLFSKDFLNG